VPKALLSVGNAGACNTPGNATQQGAGANTSAPVLQLQHVTILVTPQSLISAQQAICAAIATGEALPGNLSIVQVCDRFTQ
jgi:hypothetical protein